MRTLSFVSCLVVTSAAWADEPPFYADKANLLVVLEKGMLTPVRTSDDWAKRRAHIVANMERVMGPSPTFVKPPLDVIVEETERLPTFTRRKLTFAAGPGKNRVSAYLLVPHGIRKRVPAIVCPHPTSRDLGKGVPAGLGGKSDRHYAVHLAERGYVTIAPDYIHSGGYRFDPYENGFVSATMLGIWNHRTAVDLLQSLPEVDGDRIGAIGHSLGGHNSLFLAAFDPRIKAVVSSCGFCSFPTYMKGNLTGWSHAGYMPRIKTDFAVNPAKMPFDFPEVLAMIAPRAVLAVAPVKDHNFDVDGVKDCIAAARPVFRLLGADDKLAAIYPDAGHDFPDDARATAYAFFDRWLKDKQ